MNVLRFILKSFLELIQAITYKWLLSILKMIKQLIELIKKYCKYRKLPHDEKNATNEKCSLIDHTSFHRADPLIYSQKYLQSLGLAITWNNPDINIFKDGQIVNENELLPNTHYEVEATIWNNSYDAPVVGMKVDFTYLSFGAGTATHSINSSIVNIGVKGSAQQPAKTKVIWKTPPAGHYCLQVEFKWDDDLNPNNNFGQNNVNVQEAHSPAIFHFTLKNSRKKADRFHFKTDAYSLSSTETCQTKIDTKKTVKEKWEDILAKHGNNNFPVPAGWEIKIMPETPSLLPDEETDIEVQIEPPAGFSGQKSFNINAYGSKGSFAGGVTLTVLKS